MGGDELKERLKRFYTLLYILLGLLAFLTVLTYFYSERLFLAALSLSALGVIIVAVRLKALQQELSSFVETLGGALSDYQRQSLERFPLPLLVADAAGEILWYNTRCRQTMLAESEEFFGHNVAEFSPDIHLSEECPAQGYGVAYKGREYSVFTAWAGTEREQLHLVYFVDDSELKWFKQEYQLSRPCVLIIQVDNYDEMVQLCKEHQKPQLMTEVEILIEEEMHRYHALVRRGERDTYVAVLEERHLTELMDKRFALLDSVRAIEVSDHLPITLSIGVGRGAATYQQAEQMARQALDMSLGRGGDQAAVRTRNGYDFFGGVAKGVEKRTKVKTRIIATALSELVESSSNVLVMGHQFADLDCLGAAVGICRAVTQMGKQARIVMDAKKNLVGPLLTKLLEHGYTDSFVSPQDALGLVGRDTLLIVVDTHIPHFLESREVYERCSNVVVIDHHRKMVEHIKNAVIFYHEPYASSASEMVTELVQYLGDSCRLGRGEAEALLAGIILDTKSFVIKTGVRTFEAAAYLRRLGADTVEVRRLFASSMEEYQKRSAIVSSAEVYRGCAVSVSTDMANSDDIKLLAPQAADDLLNINDVDASFVIYRYNDTVSISARSMGKMNVQLIMEQLGGGGHLTMAGAQVRTTDIEAVRRQLLEAVDTYVETKMKK